MRHNSMQHAFYRLFAYYIGFFNKCLFVLFQLLSVFSFKLIMLSEFFLLIGVLPHFSFGFGPVWPAPPHFSLGFHPELTQTLLFNEESRVPPHHRITSP